MVRSFHPAKNAQSRVMRIAIVDDHPVSRRGLVDLVKVQNGMSVCCEAGAIDEAADRIDAEKPDLVVLDLMLHKHNSLAFLQQLKKQVNPPKVLILTLHPEEIYGERAIAAGADGYIGKDQSADEVLHAIRTVLDGGIYLSETLRSRLDTAQADGDDNGHVDITEGFTPRELEVFELLGQGFSPKQIANELSLSPKTVETHLSHLKDKLSVSSGLELTRHAILWFAEQR